LKTIGLIGGMSTFSTSVYYTAINKLVNDYLGDSNSAQLILHSINFNTYKLLQEKGDWKGIELMLIDAAVKLQNADAHCIVICSNTPHILAEAIAQCVRIPLLHIARETAKEISKCGIARVGLLGTKFTMENSFFKDHLSEFKIATVVPSDEDRSMLHECIINEFTKGIFLEETKTNYLRVIDKLRAQDAEAVVFGCTEISLLLDPSDCGIRVFDTTAIHTKAAVDFALITD
jgi:aspartate racemase